MKNLRRVTAALGFALGVGCLQGASNPFHSASAALFPADYQGTPFDDGAYRAGQRAEADLPRLPYHAFTPARVVWDGQTPNGAGWVGKEEPGAWIRLDQADSEGRQVIHYHVSLNNYRYAAFGWRWATAQVPAVDFQAYDAISFSIKVTGPKKPQELFFGVTEQQPAPLPLSDYDPDFADGAWHRLTIPVRAMTWAGPNAAARDVREFVFKTFVWDPSEYDIQLDRFTLERALIPTPPPVQPLHADPSARAQAIPGRLECAYFDRGGEGVAYHDTTPINILSGVLNQQRRHQRAHATPYHWNFRRGEGVDISFTKDWADLNHPNLVDPPVNQLYIGGTEDGEWCNYTVEVKRAGTYTIVAAYGNVADAKPIRFLVNGQSAAECNFPVVTGSMHKWNRAAVGTITFSEPGIQLLTLQYGRGYNLAYFDIVATPGDVSAAAK